MGFASTTGTMLISAILLLLPILCASAPHAHQHRHDNKLFARSALTTTITSVTAASSGFGYSYGTFLSGSVSPCQGTTCAIATPSAPSNICPAENNTSYSSSPGINNYTVICDVDYVNQNIYPFVLATSFEACLAQCEKLNLKSVNGDPQCAGFVYAPGRLNDIDDCYLKSSLNSAVPATISLVGATLATATSIARSTMSSANTDSQLSLAPTIAPSSASTQVAPVQEATNSPQSITIPQVSDAQLHGASQNNPTDQYIAHPPAHPIKLANNILVPGINSDLTTNYQIASDTGTLTSQALKVDLDDLSVVPHLSRDGGKGGEINGTHVFIFCDTAGFTTTNETHNGSMVSFVSSSVAVDSGMNGMTGDALALVDGIGEWQDDVGRLRGYAPMTAGEEAFNIALSGNGYRYAVWPETSLIPLNTTHSIQYASLVYDQVDMATQDATFTSLGNTLLTVWVDPNSGPVAERTTNQLFNQGEVAWGSIGGIRAWGSSGVGGTDGKVYVFGKSANDAGLLLARTPASGISDRSQACQLFLSSTEIILIGCLQYEYWTGYSWSPDMLSSTSTAYFINGSSMDVDLFYSPHHATFIMVYLTCDADDTFYCRYLQSDHAIVHPCPTNSSDPTSESDCVENIVKYPWSDPEVLYKAPTPAVSYIYAGAMHAGYFGNDDITNGGTKMLLSWTQHTGEDAASPQSGYAHMTAAITLE